MNRRAFIAALGGAAAWPLVARAQQGVKLWRVGYLSLSSAADNPSFGAFRLKLQDLGYVEGKNLTLDVRRAEGDYTRLAPLASELVSLAPDVIAGAGTGPTAALQRATSSIPIVMTGVTDPISSGFIKSLAKPGGNITGMATLGLDSTAKSLELLHVAVPNAKRIALLKTPNVIHEAMVSEAYSAAGKLGLRIIPVLAWTNSELNHVFATMHDANCDALVVLADPKISENIVDLANHWRLPAIYQATGFVELGGLLSYSANFAELAREGAIYVDRILKGARPADLPVELPTKFELKINLKTAKALGLEIPPTLLARADEVIE